jgi:hypothetical protein
MDRSQLPGGNEVNSAMAEEQTGHPLPAVAFKGVLGQIDRMAREGIPAKIDKKYLAGMAEGTQFQYRQAFRCLGLTTGDDQPTRLLPNLVNASSADRRELFGKIMLARWADLTGLPRDASRDDFFGVLQHRYAVASDIQRRKMLTFFVAAADYAGLQISPRIRPAKPGTWPRKPTVDTQHSAGPAPVTSTPMTRAEMRAQYFALLIKNVGEGAQLDREMLNRLDRLVGLRSADEEEDRD